MRVLDYPSIYHFLAANYQTITKRNVVEVFRNWGDFFKIEFGIKVTKKTSTCTNVFHFTAGDRNHGKYGDRIPAFWVCRGFFHICSAISGNVNYCKNFNFVLGKHYQVTIKQQILIGNYWYEIVINGVSILKIENKQAKRFSSVKLYASDPWHRPFSSDLGKISHIQIHQRG